MAEPLKGKIEKMYCSPRDSKRYMEGFLKINVKSAVEWREEWQIRWCSTLKMQCDNCRKPFNVYYRREDKVLCDKCLNKKAFEDIMK